jgi:hypothetical protein
MATIDNLCKSILEMTKEEIMALILERRQGLRTKVEKQPRQTKPKAKPKTINLESLINGMSKSEKAKLLAELGAM